MTIPLLLSLIGCSATPEPASPPEPVVAPEPAGPELATGAWSATLRTPGGPLPFGLDLSEGNGAWQAWIVNGAERIPLEEVTVDGDQLTLGFPQYDARIEAEIDEGGELLQGHWAVVKRELREEKLPFRATFGRSRRFDALIVDGEQGRVDGRWAAAFSKTEDPAVVLLEQKEGEIDVRGTVLTTVGDYRFLAGSLENRTLRLSTFDGAHAFLFQAELAEDGTLAGDYWSGSGWHETWTATPDPDATLPDGFVKPPRGIDWSALRFPDVDGEEHALSDWSGQVRVLRLMGTWCPTCADQTSVLKQLHEEHAEDGLVVVDLAFEHGDKVRNAAQLKRYREIHDIDWVTLVAGFSDKKAAAKKLPFLRRVKAYPTTLFVGKDDTVRAMHIGFTGPAAKDEHLALRAAYAEQIDALLAE